MKSTNTDKIDNNIFLNTNSNNYNQKDDEDIYLTLQASSGNPGNIKLPKVKNKNNNTNSSQALNNMEFNLKKEKNRDDKRIITSPYDEPTVDSPDMNRPQIMRIYKLNKNATFSKGNFNTISVNDFNQSSSQEKKKPNEENSKKFYGTSIKDSSTIK